MQWKMLHFSLHLLYLNISQYSGFFMVIKQYAIMIVVECISTICVLILLFHHLDFKLNSSIYDDVPKIGKYKNSGNIL